MPQPDRQPEPLGSLSGRVMDDLGQPLTSISVLARPRQQDNGPAPGTRETEVLTDADGWFRFAALPEGDYSLRAVDYQYDIASNTVDARTGSELVDLVIAYPRDLSILGAVTGAGGAPLADVQVSVSPALHEPVATDALGVFALRFSARADRTYSVIFRKDGYRERRVAITGEDWLEGDEVVLDIDLAPERNMETVTGSVRTADGEAVADEQIYLQQGQRKYRSRTDAAGRFVFENMEQGSNYTLWMSPGGRLSSYRRTGIQVTGGGLSGLEIVLERKGLGAVHGRLLDPQGRPLPGFRFQVSVDRFSRPLQTDAEGRFRIEDMPAGPLRLATPSQPRLITSGAVVTAGEELEINPVFDVGSRRFIGTVHDPAGTPVAGAAAILHWSQRSGSLLYESLRQAVADENGRFAFTDLGASTYELQVKSPGFRTASVTIPAGTEEQRIMLDPLQ